MNFDNNWIVQYGLFHCFRETVHSPTPSNYHNSIFDNALTLCSIHINNYEFSSSTSTARNQGHLISTFNYCLKEYYEIVGESRPLSGFFPTHFFQKCISNHETKQSSKFQSDPSPNCFTIDV